MSKDNGTLNPDEAKKTLIEDGRKRSSECQEDIAKLLKERRCHLDATMVLHAGTYPSLQIKVIAE